MVFSVTSGFFDTRLKILTLILQVVQVTNIRYAKFYFGLSDNTKLIQLKIAVSDETPIETNSNPLKTLKTLQFWGHLYSILRQKNPSFNIDFQMREMHEHGKWDG